MMNRRQFLAEVGACMGIGALAGPAALSELNADAGRNAAGLPMRVLGRTGAKVTIVGLGSACIGHSMPGAKAGLPVYEAALEAGINLVDTARGYDDAESYLGSIVPRWRDRIFLVTKAMPSGNTPAEAARSMQRSFEESLRLLKTDHVDLLHVHNIGQQPPELIMAAGGPLEFARRMKEQGKTRFVGVTGHQNVSRFAAVIKTGEVDAIMVALNFVDYHSYRFEQEVLPVARQQRCGLLAMKVFGGHGRGFPGYRQRGPSKMPADLLANALRYGLSISGVASAVLGVYTAEEVKQNVAWAKAYQPFTVAQMAEWRQRGQAMAPDWGLRFGPAA
jgi:uncharacterized protein